MIGDVWEWTSSEYVLYPGFKSRFEEYTDKWAINQKVLRGGALQLLKNKLEIVIEIISSHMKELFLQVLDAQLMHKLSIKKIGSCYQSEIINSTFFKIEKS